VKNLSDEELARRVQRYYQIQRRTYFIGFGLVIWLLGPFLLWAGWDSWRSRPHWDGDAWLLAALTVAWLAGAALHARAALRVARRRGSGGV
jgi:hypothetical protein